MLTIRHLNGPQAGTEVKIDSGKAARRLRAAARLRRAVSARGNRGRPTALRAGEEAVRRLDRRAVRHALRGDRWPACRQRAGRARRRQDRAGAHRRAGARRRHHRGCPRRQLSEDRRAGRGAPRRARSPRRRARWRRWLAASRHSPCWSRSAAARSHSTTMFRPAGRPRALSPRRRNSPTRCRRKPTCASARTRARISRAPSISVQLQDAEQRVRGGGTAWVVGPNLLATNAHVAILREGIRARERMIVRAPGQNGQIYEVVEHKLHPGYVPFNAFLQSDLRLISAYRGSLDIAERQRLRRRAAARRGHAARGGPARDRHTRRTQRARLRNAARDLGLSRRKPDPTARREISASRRSSTSASSRR